MCSARLAYLSPTCVLLVPYLYALPTAGDSILLLRIPSFYIHSSSSSSSSSSGPVCLGEEVSKNTKPSGLYEPLLVGGTFVPSLSTFHAQWARRDHSHNYAPSQCPPPHNFFPSASNESFWICRVLFNKSVFSFIIANNKSSISFLFRIISRQYLGEDDGKVWTLWLDSLITRYLHVVEYSDRKVSAMMIFSFFFLSLDSDCFRVSFFPFFSNGRWVSADTFGRGRAVEAHARSRRSRAFRQLFWRVEYVGGGVVIVDVSHGRSDRTISHTQENSD